MTIDEIFSIFLGVVKKTQPDGLYDKKRKMDRFYAVIKFLRSGTMLKRLYLIIAVSFIFGFSACSQSDLGVFQDNNSTPDFTIFTLVDDYEALGEAWDSIDGEAVNSALTDAIKSNTDEFVNFSQLMSEVFGTEDIDGRNPLQNILGELGIVLEWMQSRDDLYYNNEDIGSYYSTAGGNDYMTGFYSFMDTISDGSSDDDSDTVMEIARTIMNYIVNNYDGKDLRNVMDSLVSSLEDPDFQEDFTDIAKTLSKLLMRADYPMWIDEDGNLATDYDDMGSSPYSNSGMGNAVQGVANLILGLNGLFADEDTQNLVFDMIREMGDIFNATANGKDMPNVMKDLICNVEDYFTVGGSVYAANSDYNANNATTYINSDIKTSLRELWPALQQLFIKTGKSGSILHDSDGDDSPIDVIIKSLGQLKNDGIDFSEYDIRGSLDRMIRYDANGKERTVDGSNMSYLDHLIFVLMASGTVGYKDGGDTGEGNYDHGHGAATGGVLTVNDCLFSMTSGETCGMNTYTLCLDSPDGANIHRSKTPFSSAARASYRYYMYSNHPANLLLSGNCVGDAAIPNGGVGLGTVDHYVTYWPKDPIGVGELNTGRWVLGWLARVVWSGEGPYYYSPEKAGGEPETIEFDIDNSGTSETCNIYRRADGRIYAYIYKPGEDPAAWTYYYPLDGENDADENSDGQRDNRYMETWNTDYYMIWNKYGFLGGDNGYFVPGNMSGSATNAACYQITEKIPEKSASRECLSQEEAMFKNYQWLANEKRFTYVMPLKIAALGLDYATAFIRIQGNGLQGLANARKGASNGAWCRGSNNNAGDVPAAGRVAVELKAGTIVTSSLVWDTILGGGYVLPDIAGANFGPVQRMGFIVENMIASADAGVDGPYWENRSKILPVMAALMGELRKHTYYEKPASSTNYAFNDSEDNRYPFKTITDGLLSALAKPMYYYQKNSGDYPRNCWKPRVNSTTSYLNPDDDDPGTRIDPEFAPKQNRTLLSLLSENSYKSLDGMIPLLTGTELVPKLFTFLQDLGDSTNDDPVDFDINDTATWGLRRKMSYGLEQIVTTVKTTKTDAMTSGYISTNAYEPWQFATGQSADAAGEYQSYTGVRDVDLVLDEGLYALVGHNYVSDLFPGKGLAAYPDNGQRVIDERLQTTGVVVNEELSCTAVVNGTLSVKADGVAINVADSGGVISGTDVNGTGTLDYNTGEISFILNGIHEGKTITCSYTFNQDWVAFNDAISTLGDFLSPTGEATILEDVIDIMKTSLAGITLTEDEVKGFIYTVGKLLARYEEGTGWIYAGETDYDSLYKILAVYLPEMHHIIRDVDGKNYGDLLTLISDMMKEGGMVDAVIDSAQCSADLEQILDETRTLLGEMNDPDSRFNSGDQTLWDVLGNLLEDMARTIQETNDGGEDALRQLYTDYGFQYNG